MPRPAGYQLRAPAQGVLYQVVRNHYEVIGQGARLVGIGLLIGVPASLALTRLVASLLYQSNPYDLGAFAVIPAVLEAALLARAIPAWRAAGVDPVDVLRAE